MAPEDTRAAATSPGDDDDDSTRIMTAAQRQRLGAAAAVPLEGAGIGDAETRVGGAIGTLPPVDDGDDGATRVMAVAQRQQLRAEGTAPPSTPAGGRPGIDLEAETRVASVPMWPAPASPAPSDFGGDDAQATRTMAVGTMRLAPAGDDAAARPQLPNMDFTLPAAADGPAGRSAAADASLAAHHDLPTFPQFETAAPPPVAPQARPPPPPVRPPPARPRAAAAPAPASDGAGLFDDLPRPDFGLPELAPAPTKRALTLIANSAQDLRDRAPGRSIWPWALLAVVLCGVGVGAANFGRIRAAVAPPPVVAAAPPPTAPERARLAFDGAVRSFASKDYRAAIAGFEEALTLDASLTEAHRSLGIVYATTQDQARAVGHYRSYLAARPGAADAAAVQKIVDDYGRAQQAAAAGPAAAPAAPPAEAAAAPDAGRHAAKGRRRPHR